MLETYQQKKKRKKENIKFYTQQEFHLNSLKQTERQIEIETVERVFDDLNNLDISIKNI